jgi:hypothetical protein
MSGQLKETHTMSELPEGLTQTEVNRYAKLDAGIKKLQPEHKQLGDKIKAAVTKVGVFTFEKVLVNRTEANSFDSDSAEHDFPQDKFPEYYKAVLDPSKIPDKVKSKYTSKTQRVSVKVIED